MPLLVLDPGHGGRDPGALGKRLAEKDVNLKVSLRLRDALKRCGFRVLMTRETDIERVPGMTTAVDLKARAMLANTNAADLYVSWHYDACNDPKVHGVAAWIHLSQRDKPAYAKAELLAQKISDRSGQWNRGVYYGDFQVLRDTMMDAVLIEGGFITNAEEEANMSQDAFLQLQAEGAAEALCQVFGLPYVAPDMQKSLQPDGDRVVVQVNGTRMGQFGKLIDGHTYVPVRELAELLGCAINWDNSTHTVSLTKGV
ncbi:MAG: N-acetylmuramoyl-L-alanine amidase [Tumebacillaceae bacterium]